MKTPASAPVTAASAEQVAAAYQDTKLAQVLYHDWEASTYDEKWSISFDERCIDYARDRFAQVVDGVTGRSDALPYARALELGAGTGFFSLNLKLAGIIDQLSVTDLSPGMVRAAQSNAAHLGFEVDGRVADAERIPYPDDTFDLVVGHAVIHHIPDVPQAFCEILRVLKPGGRFVIAGEPTRIGDRYARALSRATWELATRVTAAAPLRARWFKGEQALDESSRAAALEAVVDLHTFDPSGLEQLAREAGGVNVRARTNEFTAAVVGWPIRTFECAVQDGALGMRWAKFAYGSWLALSRFDQQLARVVPRSWYYNVGLTGQKPPA